MKCSIGESREMIAKHISMRTVRKSHFRQLIDYLHDPQNKQERVGAITVTNTSQDHALDAALEIQATQALNTRTTVDKTYHLILSFPQGETPSPDVIQEIEARVCAALGYGEHQRISVVHHDTDNLHVHVAINKIHPTHYTIRTPYNDYKILGTVCETLEQEYGLVVDNHTARKTRSENQADDIERQAGVESLLNWIKRTCGEVITAAQSWTEMHEILRHHTLALRLRGNGLVIVDGNGVGVKASAVARALSKTKLEERLGVFEADTGQAHLKETVATPRPQGPHVEKVGTKPPPSRQGRLRSLSTLKTVPMDPGPRYDQRPLFAKPVNTAELYAQYTLEQQTLGAVRTDALARARAKKGQEIATAKRSAHVKRTAIKMLTGPGISKTWLYRMIHQSMRADIAQINATFLKERETCYQTYHRRAWADWLQEKAMQGNSTALAALRARDARQAGVGNAVGGGKARPRDFVPGLKPDTVTKAGTVIYRIGATALRDDGDRLNVSQGAGEAGLETALRLAQYRYGDVLHVQGSDLFKQQLVQVAVTANLAITFDDLALEQHRQHLTAQQSSTQKEHPHDRRRTRVQHSLFNRGRRPQSGAGAVATVGSDGRDNRRGRGDRGIGGLAGADQPHLSGFGRPPPPLSQNRLRNLSQLGVVQLAARSEMLLPGNVSGHLEHPGADGDHGLRRDVHRSGNIATVIKNPLQKKGGRR